MKADSKSGNNARVLVRFALSQVPAGCSVTSRRKMYASSHKSGRAENGGGNPPQLVVTFG